MTKNRIQFIVISECVNILLCTSLGGAEPVDTLSSSTSITFDRMVLVAFNSVGRRDMPLVSVAATSLVVSEALSSKISAVVLFPETISSACKSVYHNMTVSAKMSHKSNFSWIRKMQLFCTNVPKGCRHPFLPST